MCTFLKIKGNIIPLHNLIFYFNLNIFLIYTAYLSLTTTKLKHVLILLGYSVEDKANRMA